MQHVLFGHRIKWYDSTIIQTELNASYRKCKELVHMICGDKATKRRDCMDSDSIRRNQSCMDMAKRAHD
jgi:hypothetical protein